MIVSMCNFTISSWLGEHFSNTSAECWNSTNVRCLYAFLKPGSSIHDLPADKLPMARPSQQESLILDILGKERAEEPGQLQMALKFMSELKQTLGLKTSAAWEFRDVNRNFTNP